MLRPAAAAVLALMLAAGPFALGAAGQTVTFVPPDTSFVLEPGQQQIVDVEVCLPGKPAKADVYLLADVTTSMGPILDQLKTDAALITTTLLGTPGIDVAVGLGSYRDFFNQPFLPQPFVPQLAPTKVGGSVFIGINSWVAGGGGDPPESQFYALWKLATDPIVGWRPGAKRIIVWFGDSPGHDPICETFVAGFGDPPLAIDEAVLTAALQASGPGGAAVIAIGTVTSLLVYPDAINSDPQIGGFNIDYSFACSQGGTGGQAERLAAETNGTYTQVTDPSQITDAILDSVGKLLNTADIELQVSGDIGPFVTDISPPSFEDVVLPTSPTEQVCVQFQVTLEGPPCGAQTVEFDGSIDVLVDGEVIDAHPVHVEQPGCVFPPTLLLIGPRRIDVPFPGGDSADKLLVLPTLSFLLGHGAPILPIPDKAALIGVDVYLQCILRDHVLFPADPIKTSNGLIVIIGNHDLGFPYGTGSGLSLLLSTMAVPGGLLKVNCQLNP